MSKLKSCTNGIYSDSKIFIQDCICPMTCIVRVLYSVSSTFVRVTSASFPEVQPKWFYPDGRSAQMLHCSIHATAATTATINRSTLQSDRLASIIVHHLFPDQPNSSIVMNLVCHLGHAAIPC